MIDHIVIDVSDIEASRSFYSQALEPLGMSELMTFPGRSGFGKDGKPDFWIREGETIAPAHVAFGTDRQTVDAFHEAALAAGASDNGAPGPREIYHPNYYGAFVLDPDGHNIEAVCHH